jgi:signal transduction histidine kinase
VPDKSTELRDSYAAALQDYLSRRDEAGLQRAYELGRAGLANGVGILDLATVHHQALIDVVHRARTREDARETVKAVADFFVESLSPFEMTHRGFRESAIALRHLYESLEAEIKRIAHTVHDEAGQVLASAYLALGEVESELAPAGRPHLRKVTDLLGEVERNLRSLAHELRPTALDDLGLLPALELLAEGASLRATFTGQVRGMASPAPARTRNAPDARALTVRVDSALDGSLPLVVETAIYRIVQEALANVTKHAGASHVTVRLWRDDRMSHCVIRDNGCGFDAATVLMKRDARRGLGLVGIQERVAALGGSLRIESGIGEGTEVNIAIPIEGSHVTRDLVSR